MMGFSDIHSHFIYGVDDGARTKAEMEAMLDAAHADGITELFATSHMTPGLRPFDFATYQQHLEEARSYCRSNGYPMVLYSGAEIMYTPVLRDYIIDHRLPTLADSDHVLMEFVPDISLRELEAALELLARYGYVTVLAHIERYACLLHGNNVGKLRERYTVRCQVNANTVLSKRGFFQARRIHGWFEKKQIDFVASDAHHVQNRPFRMRASYQALKEKYDPNYVRSLVGLQ